MFEPNFYTKKFFTQHLLAIERKITEVLTNKRVYLGLSILELSETLMYELWYDDVKLKLCYMDIDT